MDCSRENFTFTFTSNSTVQTWPCTVRLINLVPRSLSVGRLQRRNEIQLILSGIKPLASFQKQSPYWQRYPIYSTAFTQILSLLSPNINLTRTLFQIKSIDLNVTHFMCPGSVLYHDDPIAETTAKVRIKFHIKQDINSKLNWINSKTLVQTHNTKLYGCKVTSRRV